MNDKVELSETERIRTHVERRDRRVDDFKTFRMHQAGSLDTSQHITK